MYAKANLTKALLLLSVSACLTLASGCAVNDTYTSAPPQTGGAIVVRVASSQNDDPFEAGKQAALLLREQMGQTAPHTIVLTECFEDKAPKKQLLKGVCSVLKRI